MNTRKLLLLPLLVPCLLVAAAVPGEDRAEIGAKGDAPRRLLTKTLFLDNGLSWGKWGEPAFCPEGSFALDMEVKFEDYEVADLDETALNAVKLYCDTPDFHNEGYIMSSEGSHGKWQGMRLCTGGYLTSMRARVLGTQLLGDDVAVQNIQMECDHGSTILTGVDESKMTKIHQGEYGLWSRCPPGSAVCGIDIRLEEALLVLDDTAVGDIKMYCCALQV